MRMARGRSLSSVRMVLAQHTHEHCAYVRTSLPVPSLHVSRSSSLKSLRINGMFHAYCFDRKRAARKL